MPKLKKKCEQCSNLAPAGNRFCTECVKKLKEEMKESGYLQYRPQARAWRSGGKQEDTYETKYGG